MRCRELPVRNERGMALVVALLVLVTISLLATALMLNVSTEKKILGHTVRDAQAFAVSEAGVAEVCSRLREGDIALSTANPRSVAQLFLCSSTSIPVPANADTQAIATAQPAGAWLDYSTATKSSDVLTCEFRTDAGKTQIYYYDDTVTPPINTVSGMPIYRITSTGRVGNNKVRVQTDVIRKPVSASVKAALMANVGIDFKGNCEVCGYDHALTTPTGTRAWSQCSPYHAAAGNLPGGWSTQDIQKQGSPTINGSPSWKAEYQTGFFAGPWEPLGMSQADFYAWIGASQSVEPSPPDGLVHLDNDGTAQNQSGAYAYHGSDGEGLLYVDGDLTINGNFSYRGLVYVEGNLKINGTAWILGAIVVRGKTRIDIANGNFTLLYSSDAITQALTKASGNFVTLSWRQL